MRSKTIRKYFIGVLRVQLYVGCVAALLACVSFVHAYDRAEHALGELSFDLLSGLDGLSKGVEQVEVNGESFTFVATTLSQPPERLLQEFEQRCARASGSLELDLAPLLAEARKQHERLPQREPARWLTNSQISEGGERAVGSCFVRPGESAAGSLWRRAEAFVETGKLGAFGGLRYVRADRQADGELTRVLAVASDAELDLAGMLPEQGDARGRDPRMTPRPPESVRTFSALVRGSGQGAYVYESTLGRAALLRHFDEQVALRGLSAVPLEYHELADARAYASERGAVVLALSEQDGKRVVSIFELGTLPAREEK